MKPLYRIFGILVLSVVGASASVWGLTVTPQVLEIRMHAGERVTGNIVVETDRPGVSVEVQPFTIDSAGNSRSDLGRVSDLGWIKSISEVRNKPKHNVALMVPYDIRLPKEPKAEYTAKIAIAELLEGNDPITANAAIEIGVVMGIPVYVSVIEKETHKLAINSVEYWRDRAELKVVVANQGSVQERPVITYKLYKFGGLWPFVSRDAVGDGDVNRYWPVLGEKTREFTLPINLEPGDYEIELTANYGMRYGFQGNFQKVIAFSVR